MARIAIVTSAPPLTDGGHLVHARALERALEAAGHHEMLNWHVLTGAMSVLKRKPVVADYVETFIFQSDKCFAAFPPN